MKEEKAERFESKVEEKLFRVLGTKRGCELLTALGTIVHPIKKFRNCKRINELASVAVQKGYIVPERKKALCNSYISLVNSGMGNGNTEIPAYFCEAKLECIQKEYSKSFLDVLKDNSEPLVVVGLKNEITRIPSILGYYRNVLGCKGFIIIDNGSTDGTFEYLEKQEDVKLYKCLESFNSRARNAWVNRVIEEVGRNRWYLIIDADECFAYPQYETISFKKYTQKLLEKNIHAVKALCVEFYPKGNLFSAETANEFLDEYIYFDPDSDYYFETKWNGRIYGGLHNRVFGQEWTLRTVVRLMYPGDRRFPVSPHDIYPRYESIEAPIGLILKHYKFLKGDMKKIEDAINSGNYDNGSKAYVGYRKAFVEDGLTGFWNSESVAWCGEESFAYFPFIKDLLAEK